MPPLTQGVDVVKLFPAEPLGGVPVLRTLVAAGASFIAPPQLLAAGDFAEITRRAAQAAALVRGG